MIFRTECAWCSTIISEEPCSEAMSELAVYPETNIIVSHGLCPKCSEELRKKEFPNDGGDDDV